MKLTLSLELIALIAKHRAMSADIARVLASAQANEDSAYGRRMALRLQELRNQHDALACLIANAVVAAMPVTNPH